MNEKPNIRILSIVVPDLDKDDNEIMRTLDVISTEKLFNDVEVFGDYAVVKEQVCFLCLDKSDREQKKIIVIEADHEGLLIKKYRNEIDEFRRGGKRNRTGRSSARENTNT